MRWVIRWAYWLWRAPRGQTLVLIAGIGWALWYAYFQVAGDKPEAKLAVIGAAAAASVAVWGVVNQWSISRRQLTVQFMRELETDHDYIAALAEFNAAAQHNSGLYRLAKNPPTNPAKRDLWIIAERSVRLVLNQDELIAIGIKNSILDYRVVCTLSRSSILRRYDYAKAYVEELRTNTRLPTMYVELERLALRLRRDDLHGVL